MHFPRSRTLAACSAVLLSAFASLNVSAQSVTTTPVGAVTISIPAGTGSAKKSSLVSIPLLDTANISGAITGRITGVTSNTISDSAAGWTAGALSNATTPYLIQITSGSAAGLFFQISTNVANTATSITISPEDSVRIADLNSLGLQVGLTTGDTYRIIPCDTLASLFGTPAQTGVLGGTSAQAADTILITTNGNSRTYFYSTTLGRWTQVTLGNPDASNVVIRPDYGIQYSRLQNTNLDLIITGSVPTGQRRVYVKNSGVTMISQYWPIDTMISQTNLQTASGWITSSTPTTADTLLVTASTGAKTYFHDGTNWKQQTLGNPIKDGDPITAASSIIINKRGSNSGYTILTQSSPYSL